ncbi:MAG: hypothetical protein OEY36_07540 [Gammaproteobacteria bacterium]|nr:hypothetical protein [Gammaproteobacteria bacterium]
MLYFIACHAPDLQGAKLADGLARAHILEMTPHIAFKSKELAQYYLDSRNASKLCYLLSEEKLTDTIWQDFRDGIVLFNSVKDIKKSLKEVDYVTSLNHMAYTPALSFA